MSAQFSRNLGHDTCIRTECSIEIETTHPRSPTVDLWKR